MGHGEIEAKPAKKNKNDEIQKLVIDVYVGVFFDGTNNNMLQSMIGQKFRRDKIFKSRAEALKKLGYKNANEVIAKPRSFWENKHKDVFTKSDLDKLYGGASVNSNDLEKEIVAENTDYSYSSVQANNEDNPINFGLGDQFKKKMNEIADPKGDPKKSKNYLPDKAVWGAFSQSSTYTNPCILWSIYSTGEEQDQQDRNHKIYHHRIYVEGSGSDSTVTLAANVDGAVDDVIGLGFGVGYTGVSAKCRKMATQINNIYGMYHKPDVKEIRFHFDVFGFSRGATTARLFTYIVNPNNENNISNNDFLLFTGKAKTFLPLHDEDSSSLLTKKEVRLLGIFDTVASIGILRDPFNTAVADAIKIKDNNVEFTKYGKSQFHDRNVDDFGLYATTNAKDVLHICALDENRINFSLTDIESSVNSGNGTEIFLPGCHTDIGGGAGLGLDDFKVINKETSNIGEIAGTLMQKVTEAKNLASDVKKTLVGAKNVGNGVKSIVNGYLKVNSGDLIGIQNILEGVCTTYNGTRSTVAGVHGNLDTVVNILYETGQQTGAIDPALPPLPQHTDGSSDFTKKGVLRYAADTTGSKRIENLANQQEKLIEGGNAFVSEVGKTKGKIKDFFNSGKELIDSIFDDNPIMDTVDKVDQTLGSFTSLLHEINTTTDSVSTIADAIKSAIHGHPTTDNTVSKYIRKLTLISDGIITECTAIRNDITLTKDILDMLRWFKNELTKKNKVDGNMAMKKQIDNVNDAIAGVAQALGNCNTTIAGVEMMLHGLQEFHGVHGSVNGIHELTSGIKATYLAAHDSIDSITQTSTGIWDNLDNIFQNTMNGLFTPKKGSGQGSGQDIKNNLTQAAQGLEGIDQAYSSLEQNTKLALEKLKGLKFDSMNGIENSLSSVSSAIRFSESALDNLSSMVSSVQQTTSNLMGLSVNSYTALTKDRNFKEDFLNPAKKSLLEYLTPETGSSANVLNNIGSNLQNMASGLTEVVNSYGSSSNNLSGAIETIKGISNCNLHSFNGVLSAFSSTAQAITMSLNSMKGFKSTLEKAKKLTTNTIGLGSNLLSATVQGYQGIKNGLNNLSSIGNAIKDYLNPDTGSSNSVIENMSSNIKNALSGITGVHSSYDNTLSKAQNAFQQVMGLKNANFNSVQGIAQALTNAASAITSTIGVAKSIPAVFDNIKKTSTNIMGLAKNSQTAFTVENGHFVIVNECSEFINERCDEIKETYSQIKDIAKKTKEIITGEKKITLPDIEKRKICLYNYYPCAGPKEEKALPMSMETLQSLGWVGSDTSVETKQTFWTGRATDESLDKGDTVVVEGTKVAGVKRLNNIGFYKYVHPGYSNISLKLMRTWSTNKAPGVFKPLNEIRYPIPSDLKLFYGQVESSCLKSKGRFFCVPKYDNVYRKLRLKYLHFSTNQQWFSPADNSLVNGPSLALLNNKMVIIRRIYIGKKGSPTAGPNDSVPGKLLYLYEYIGSKGTMKEINFDLNDVEVTHS